MHDDMMNANKHLICVYHLLQKGSQLTVSYLHCCMILWFVKIVPMAKHVWLQLSRFTVGVTSPLELCSLASWHVHTPVGLACRTSGGRPLLSPLQFSLRPQCAQYSCFTARRHCKGLAYREAGKVLAGKAYTLGFLFNYH